MVNVDRGARNVGFWAVKNPKLEKWPFNTDGKP